MSLVFWNCCDNISILFLGDDFERKDNMKTIALNPSKLRIEIEFPFSMGLKNKVKAIPDSKFDWDDKVWYLPVSKLHASLASQFGREYSFFIDEYVSSLSKTNKVVSYKTRSKLFPFQIEGLDFLHRTGGRALLADLPGLGKTYQTLAYMEEVKFRKVLVVSPASVSYMWQDKTKELLGWSTDVIEGYTNPFDERARVIICSYAVFTRRVDKLKSLGFNLVVFDEAHALSNTTSARSRASRLLQTQNVLLLSGTPFLNRPKELWPLLNLLQPGVWSSFWKFAHRYCDAKRDYFGHWNFDGAENLAELKDKISTIMIRRTKEEVLKDLPELTINYLPYLTQSETLVRSYKEAYEVAKKATTPVRGRLLALRRVVGLMKVKPGIELAEDLLVDPNSKVVLFAIHKTVVAELHEGLSNYKSILIVGDTPQEERNNLVQQFQNDPDTRVAIISEAGGEGINLYAASNLIFVERAWNPGKETQIQGRIHRIGQKNNCQIYYIIAKATIDERIHQIINKKKEVLGQVYSLEDIPINDLFTID